MNAKKIITTLCNVVFFWHIFAYNNQIYYKYNFSQQIFVFTRTKKLI